MLWSKSRLSRHISRMEERGLVTRENCATDARGAIIVLTDGGMRAIEAAAPDHVESVRRHLIDVLTGEQIEVLGDIADTVLRHLVDELGTEKDELGTEKTEVIGIAVGPTAGTAPVRLAEDEEER